MVRTGYFGIDRFHFGIYGVPLPETESERLISIDLPTGGASGTTSGMSTAGGASGGGDSRDVIPYTIPTITIRTPIPIAA